MPLPGEGVTRAAARLGVDPVEPITLLGVAALGEPDLLVEVEATAVLDGHPVGFADASTRVRRDDSLRGERCHHVAGGAVSSAFGRICHGHGKEARAAGVRPGDDGPARRTG